MTSYKEIAKLIGHDRTVTSLAFSPDGVYVASGGFNNTIKIWEVSTGREIATLLGHQNGLNSLCFSPDGRHLASGGEDETIKLWELSGRDKFFTLIGHQNEITTIDFSPDSEYLASGDYDRQIKIWNLSTGKVDATLTDFEDAIDTLSFSPDGRQLAAGSFDNKIKAWDVTGERKALTLSIDNEIVSSLSYSPDGKFLATGGSDKFINIWELSSGRKVLTFLGHNSGINSIQFSPDGKFLTSGGFDGIIKLWIASNGKELTAFQGHEGYITSMSFSPDGKFLASASQDKIIMIWEIAGKKNIKTLKGHLEDVWTVNFFPNGEYLASMGLDDSIKIWDVSNSKEILTIKGFFTSMGISPDGRFLAVSEMDDTIKLMDLEYILSFLWLGLDYPYKKKDVKKMLKAIEKETGFVLERLTPVDVGGYYSMGLDNIKNKEYSRAIDVLNKALGLEPKNISVLNSLGWIYYLLRDYDRAESYFKNAVDIDKGYLEPQLNIALIYLTQAKFKASYDHYRYVVEQLNPSRNAIAKAIQNIETILESKPDMIFAYLLRGYLNSNYGPGRSLKANADINKFINEFKGEEEWKNAARELLSERNNDPRVWYYMGDEYWGKGEYDKANDAYNRVLNLEPKEDMSLNNFGWNLYLKENYEVALAYFFKAIENDSGDFYAQFNIALTYMALKDFEKSYNYYIYIIKKLKPEKSLMAIGIVDVEELMKKNPSMIFTYLIRGILKKETGALQQAKEDIVKFIKEYDGSAKWKKIAKELLTD
jgi:WD40 repeat protein/Tfp pilus assembly protein PilF